MQPLLFAFRPKTAGGCIAAMAFVGMKGRERERERERGREERGRERGRERERRVSRQIMGQELLY